MKTPEEHRVSDQSHMCPCFSLQPVTEPSATLERRKDYEGSLRHIAECKYREGCIEPLFTLEKMGVYLAAETFFIFPGRTVS